VYELENFISPGKLIGVAWGFSGKENLLKELPEKYILNNPQDLANILP
jgi:phosphoglycolate phosphatase-like HAD superfamily hydrolase